MSEWKLIVSGTHRWRVAPALAPPRARGKRAITLR